MRKRTSKLAFKTGMVKFGRKEAAVGCIFINGDFETGDLTGWTCYTDSGACSVLEESGNHYARLVVWV